MIEIGTYTATGPGVETPTIYCPSHALKQHMQRPWMKAEIAERVGLTWSDQSPHQVKVASLSDELLARHVGITGKTGFGKSRVIESLCIQQVREGCSLVVLDPKGGTFADLLLRVEAMGIAPEKVTIISPLMPGAIPGFNMLLAGIPVPQIASDFVSVLQASTSSWGPRMQDLLTSALIVVGVHRLSLFELVRLLGGDAAYREGLLAQPVQTADWLAYEEARDYFLGEFAAWGKAERAQAVGPITNKIREIIRSEFLFALLCSRTNTLDLSQLWREQRVVLVHLDRPSLGEAGTRIVAGVIANLLFRTALRDPGPGRVALVIDELATVEQYVGKTLCEILAVARSQRLRLITANQHFSQLSDNLRTSLMGNVGGELIFRLGSEDARLVATSLSAGVPEQVSRLSVSPESGSRLERAEWAKRRHIIRSASGQPLRFDPERWRKLYQESLFGRNVLPELQCIAAAQGLRLYVLSADTEQPVELSQYVKGLSSEDFWIEGPVLSLVVTYPRIRVTGVERITQSDYVQTWTRIIQELPIQHAVLRGLNAKTGVIKVVDVLPPTPTSDNQEFIQRALQANGQSAQQVADLFTWRKTNVQRFSGGRSYERTESDDSIF